MTTRKMMFLVADEEPATRAGREPETLATIEQLEAVVARLFGALRHEVLDRRAQDLGAIEYDSWRVTPH